MSMPRYADLDTDNWRLLDGEERNREHPDTFEIPDPTVRHSLSPGDIAKLMFEIRDPDPDPGEEPEIAVERMWVVMTRRVGNRYVGKLDNQPFSLDATHEEVYLRLGAEICFGPEHVIDVLDEPADDKVLAEPPTRRWRG